MASCPVCGKEYPEDVPTCPDCGVTLAENFGPVPDRSDDDLVEIKIDSSPVWGEAIKDFLEQNGISCVMEDSRFIQHKTNAIGDGEFAVRILVREGEMETAKEMLRDFFEGIKEESRTITCPNCGGEVPSYKITCPKCKAKLPE
jgi:hypothetical protein